MENLGKFYIDGQWVAPMSKRTHTLINPATEKPIADVAMASAEDVDRAVEAAKRAFATYGMSTRDDRLDLLRKLLDRYNASYDRMAELMSEEMGSPIQFSRDAQALMGRVHLEAGIKALEDFTFEEMRGDLMVSREPIGVCGLITPWNWPMNQLMMKVAPALAAGCTIVVKPSEYSPLSAALFAEIVDQAGFPPGVYNQLLGFGEEAGAAISKHPDVQMVSITGSTRAGVAVARDAADTVKRVHQELGGKSPYVIFDDADMEAAVTDCVNKCFVNCGQACIASSRMLVPAARMDEAAELAANVANAIKVGSPSEADSDLGPVVNKNQFEHIQRLINCGVAEGAKLVAGGPGRPEGLDEGYYIRPTVFSHVTNDMEIAREEAFGPVLTIIGFESEEEAIAIANDTPYGLAAYVQSKDVEKARRAARALRAGSVFINGAAWDPTGPFGGYGQSGNGREGAEYGLADFLEIKATAGYG